MSTLFSSFLSSLHDGKVIIKEQRVVICFPAVYSNFSVSLGFMTSILLYYHSYHANDDIPGTVEPLQSGNRIIIK